MYMDSLVLLGLGVLVHGSLVLDTGHKVAGTFQDALDASLVTDAFLDDKPFLQEGLDLLCGVLAGDEAPLHDRARTLNVLQAHFLVDVLPPQIGSFGIPLDEGFKQCTGMLNIA